MDDATDIISAVANIVMEYQQEFNAAVPTMLPNEWSGVDADARARLAAKTRAEVQLLQAHLVVLLRFRDAIAVVLQVLALKEIFVRVQRNIEAVPGVDVTPAELRLRLRALNEERDRLRKQNAALQEELDKRDVHVPDLK
jgi:hypothetical protein